MILTDEQAKDRLESPNNLANRFGKVVNTDSTLPYNHSIPSLESVIPTIPNSSETEVESDEEIPDLSNLEEIPVKSASFSNIAVEPFPSNSANPANSTNSKVQIKKIKNKGRLAGIKGLTTEQRTEIAIAKADPDITQNE